MWGNIRKIKVKTLSYKYHFYLSRSLPILRRVPLCCFLTRSIDFTFNSENMNPGDSMKVCIWTATPGDLYHAHTFSVGRSNLGPKDTVGITTFTANRLVTNQTITFETDTNIIIHA